MSLSLMLLVVQNSRNNVPSLLSSWLGLPKSIPHKKDHFWPAEKIFNSGNFRVSLTVYNSNDRAQHVDLNSDEDLA